MLLNSLYTYQRETGKWSMFRKFYGRGVLANISKLKSNIKVTKKVSGRPRT